MSDTLNSQDTILQSETAVVEFPVGQNLLKFAYTYDRSDPEGPLHWRPEVTLSDFTTLGIFEPDQTVKFAGTEAYEIIDLVWMYYMVEKPLTFTLNENNEIVGHYHTEIEGGPTQQFILSQIDEIRTGIQQSAVYDLAGYDDDLNIQFTIPKEVTVRLGDGDNTINVSGQYSGYLGDHDITVGDGDNALSTLVSQGSITVGGGNNIIGTGSGDDRISGGGPNGSICLVDHGGNNTIDLTVRSADITTGSGNDTISVYGAANTTINDTGGDNVIVVDRGTNKIFVGSGDDQITAGDGYHFIHSAGGSNTITVLEGDSTIRLYWEADEAAQVGEINILNIGNGNNTIFAGKSMDNITGGDGDNAIFDTGGKNTIKLGSGDNWIQITEGDNAISLGDGNNEINIAYGTTAIAAGHGNNEIHITYGPATITAGDGNNEIHIDYGTAEITVGDGSNVIFSGTGDNRITAGDGGNFIDAGGGADWIATGSGDDIIFTGVVRNGETTFIAGGGGADEFHLQGGQAWITDFSMAEDDQIFFEIGAYSEQGVFDIDDLSMSVFDDKVFIQTRSGGDTLLTIELKDGVPADFNIHDEITFEAPSLVSSSPQADLFDF